MATGSNLDVPSSLPLPEPPAEYSFGSVPPIVELTPENMTVADTQEPRTDVDWPPANQNGPNDPSDTPGWSEARMPAVSQGFTPTGTGPGGQDYPSEAPAPPENTTTAGAPPVSTIGDHTATAAEVMQEAEQS